MIRLPPNEIDQLGISKTAVLDSQTSAVIKALWSRGVEVAAELLTNSENYSVPYANLGLAALGPGISISVYHDLSFHNVKNRSDPTALIGRFHDKGFEGVDSKCWFGTTPLMIAQSAHNVRLVLWFLEHGADPWVQVPNHVLGYTVAHSMWATAPEFGGDAGDFLSAFHFLKDKSPLDSCRCGCSPEGCCPLSTLWKRASCGVPSQPHTDDDDWCVSWYERMYGFTPEVELMVLRIATFETLGLRHTCCDDGLVDIKEEDREEIWDEDAAILDKLEELVAEHKRTLRQSRSRLSDFLRNEWKARMEHVMQELQWSGPQLEEQRQAMAEMGISMRYELSESECEDAESSGDNEVEDDEIENHELAYDEIDAETYYWISEIERVMSQGR
ncbi:hypothetical protein CSOJ01_03810 [Colletotrichum sojae]|uniref:Ankyrin repeat protein n=1 Tax=Colletotrichum sojae TaxID=2175907 RepID=A0A8H6JKC4_9PEZI|nr:hypothetical protein CSOJ01_03810 [Colletotrichum sojae]